MSSEYGIYLIVFFAVLILSAAASELFFRQREVSVRVSKSSSKAGEEFHIGDTTIADLGEAENRLIRRYFEITRRDTNANSTQNRLIRAGYFAAGAVTTFQVIRAVACISVLVAAVWALNRIAPDMSQMSTLIVEFCYNKNHEPGEVATKKLKAGLLPVETVLRRFLQAPITVTNIVFHGSADSGGIFFHQSLYGGHVVVDPVFCFGKLWIEVVKRCPDPQP